ncbi:FIG000875: Thioredoxin domain-containing protein EC-YbbN [hydrothermal vent metagenome]|uniref:FIG000875: Thioredoxin domain-containing protein EC-YbbN n=1 Tax=hydrothermal vent metagenome TaxID=652676 RepID=A0A3B0UC03_9ZZZZ
MALEADDLDDLGSIKARLEADPNDHQARMDMAIQLNASGDRQAAAQNLIEIIKRDREWNDGAARTRLLELFEAWGAADPASVAGRKALSRVLFS